jgi:hypothetical protein
MTPHEKIKAVLEEAIRELTFWHKRNSEGVKDSATKKLCRDALALLATTERLVNPSSDPAKHKYDTSGYINMADKKAKRDAAKCKKCYDSGTIREDGVDGVMYPCDCVPTPIQQNAEALEYLDKNNQNIVVRDSTSASGYSNFNYTHWQTIRAALKKLLQVMEG